MTDRRAEFLVKNGRPPTTEEELAILEQTRADRRAADAERHEEEIRRLYLEVPGSTPDTWEREKASILARDREARTVAAQASARSGQRAIYSDSF